MRLSIAALATAAFGTTLIVSTTAMARSHQPRPAIQPAHASATAWVPTRRGMPLPRHALRGGSEPQRHLFICRARYKRGLHPGKIVAGYCNIGWGGREILRARYDVLVVRQPSAVRWTSYRSRHFHRTRSVRAGFEPGRTLDICRARYRGGLHPGKVVDGRCNVGWGGREILLNRFEVLVHRDFARRVTVRTLPRYVSVARY